MTSSPRPRLDPTETRWGAGTHLDDFGWLAGDGPQVAAALEAERACYDARVAHLVPLREELAAEMRGRLPAADPSVSWLRGGYAYRTRFGEGADLPCLIRCLAPEAPKVNEVAPEADEEVLVDLVAVAAAAGSPYADLGLSEPSPDGRVLAWSVDLTGGEVFELRFLDLATGTGLPDVVTGTYYTGAWDAAGTTFLYTVPDDAMRPWQVRAHVLGTDPALDRLVLQEDDERFEVTVVGSRSGEWIVLESRSRDTTEAWLVPTSDVTAAPRSVRARRAGIEYAVDHAPWVDAAGARHDELLVVTNDGAPEFRVLAVPTHGGDAPWREVVAPDPAVRVVGADAFEGYVVLSLRVEGLTRLRVLALDGSASHDVTPPSEVSTVRLDRTEEWATPVVTIATESHVEPTVWWDLDLATGARHERQRAQAPGLDPARYRGRRVWATARDGVKVPVTLVHRADVPLDGSAPCLLYGYGAYEYVFEPEFDRALPSLLDRGVVFAHAHVRGGGERGRWWWEDGRLLHKRTTFDDFVDVRLALGHDGELGLVDGRRIVSRGLSAGGLLQGAVYSQRPELWRAVVAEVPFVDVVTAMSDPSIPLTVNEWDEWGDPRDPAFFDYMLGYSPYDNPPPAGVRPALLVTGAVHDPRVLVREPAKWVSRLRATDPALGDGIDPDDPTSPGTVLFRVETSEGSHVGPAGRFGHLDYEAEVYAWVLAALS